MKTWLELQDYLGFCDEDAQRLSSFSEIAKPHLPAITDRFYELILANTTTRAVLQGPEQVARLKITLRQWMLQLLEGPYDQEYWAQRRKIGRAHVRVGLPNRFVFAAMNVIRAALIDLARSELPHEEAWATCLALVKITDLELAVMSSSYMHAHETQELRDLQALIVENLPVTVLCLDARCSVTASSRTPRPGPAPDSVAAYLNPELLAHTDLEEHIERSMESGLQVSIPRIVTTSGRHFRVTLLPLDHPLARLLVHVDEVTDTVQVETRLREAEHLARIGSLAANVAHEIRNPLAAISSTLQVIGKSLPEADRRRGILDKVQQNVRRLDRLVNDLLGYARPAAVHIADLDLPAVLRDAKAASGVAATTIQHGGVPPLRGDIFYVEQILVNLLQNARDAAGCEDKVELVIGPGPNIRVRDGGPGIDPAFLHELFEPFATTKTRGTGLGLAISRKLARAMGASLVLESATGELGGACFLLSLAESPTT